ncbi:uncharacterized protein LOC144323933 [Canis aureus]
MTSTCSTQKPPATHRNERNPGRCLERPTMWVQISWGTGDRFCFCCKGQKHEPLCQQTVISKTWRLGWRSHLNVRGGCCLHSAITLKEYHFTLGCFPGGFL